MRHVKTVATFQFNYFPIWHRMPTYNPALRCGNFPMFPTLCW